MAKHYQETDYFVPALAPYVQWVNAYTELIPALYEEHKTVRRTWKAFKKAIPGVEQRLQFSVFEQILLFSLFLSEWHEARGAFHGHNISRALPQAADYPGETQEPGSDAVIHELRNISDERDKALWNLKGLEEKFGELKTQKEQLESRIEDLEADLDKRQRELDTANENLLGVIRELDTQRDQNAGLRLEVASLGKKRTSLEDRIQKLPKTISGPNFLQSEEPDSAKVSHGGSQMVIQWAGQTADRAVGPGDTETLQAPVPPQKVGRWNAQKSKDGYYRLYRKIMGRVHSIYIGKDLDIEKARAKVAEKEKKLLDLTIVET